MVDKITPEQRRKIMQAIKSKSKMEDLVAKELWKRNIRYTIIHVNSSKKYNF